MAKLYLTEEELEQFPTISELVTQIGDREIEEWGFRQNVDGDISLGEDTSDRQLVIPLSDVHEEARIAFGESYSPSNIKVIYSVEIYPDPYFVCFELIDLSEYKEFMEYTAKYPPIILGPTTN
ncbi:MAG: hypothetical protein K9L31_02865 [Candidatus Pacebacteria bacterium]|nr:hypothetical protein [Candidatus Paceibacterota bacterium]